MEEHQQKQCVSPPSSRRSREYNDYIKYSCALNPWLHNNNSDIINNPNNQNLENADYNEIHKWGLMTRTIADYKRIEQIGEGTYGQVYKAQCRITGRIVALKKIRIHSLGHYGLPPTIIREIKILKKLQHPNMVSMIEVLSSKGVEYLEGDSNNCVDNSNVVNNVVVEDKANSNGNEEKIVNGGTNKNESKLIDSKSKHKNTKQSKSQSIKNKHNKKEDGRSKYKGNLYIVLEYITHDLTGLMDMAYKFSEIQVKTIFYQLLNVLSYMHENKYVHRDIKCSNILIDNNFRVKLADFGLARQFVNVNEDDGKVKQLTNKVITLWYRPPEILLGSTEYGTSVDMWSAGCILAELILGRPILPGKTEMEQIGLIFDLVGTPNESSWEGYRDLKLVKDGDVSITSTKVSTLRTRYDKKISNSTALNLIEKLLSLDPNKRMTAKAALSSRYFMIEPRAPTNPNELDAIDFGLGDLANSEGNFHEFQTKKRRKEAKLLADKIAKKAKSRGLSQKQIEEESNAAYREHMKATMTKATTTAVTSTSITTNAVNNVASELPPSNNNKSSPLPASAVKSKEISPKKDINTASIPPPASSSLPQQHSSKNEEPRTHSASRERIEDPSSFRARGAGRSSSGWDDKHKQQQIPSSRDYSPSTRRADHPYPASRHGSRTHHRSRDRNRDRPSDRDGRISSRDRHRHHRRDYSPQPLHPSSRGANTDYHRSRNRSSKNRYDDRDRDRDRDRKHSRSSSKKKHSDDDASLSTTHSSSSSYSSSSSTSSSTCSSSTNSVDSKSSSVSSSSRKRKRSKSSNNAAATNNATTATRSSRSRSRSNKKHKHNNSDYNNKRRSSSSPTNNTSSSRANTSPPQRASSRRSRSQTNRRSSPPPPGSSRRGDYSTSKRDRENTSPRRISSSSNRNNKTSSYPDSMKGDRDRQHHQHPPSSQSYRSSHERVRPSRSPPRDSRPSRSSPPRDSRPSRSSPPRDSRPSRSSPPRNRITRSPPPRDRPNRSSPPRDRLKRSPPRDRPTRSPPRRSPPRDRPNRSPPRDRTGRSPPRDRLGRSPPRDRPNRSPPRDRSGRSSPPRDQRSNRANSPSHRGGPPSSYPPRGMIPSRQQQQQQQPPHSNAYNNAPHSRPHNQHDRYRPPPNNNRNWNNNGPPSQQQQQQRRNDNSRLDDYPKRREGNWGR